MAVAGTTPEIAAGEAADEPAQAAAPVRVGLANVGCKLNSYEIEAFTYDLDQRGFEIVPFDAEADVYVVNTCTVTGSGDADSRKLVRRAGRRNPDAAVVATGCYAQRRPEELEGAGADLIVGNGDKAKLVDRLQQHLAGTAPTTDLSRPPRTETFLSIDGVVDKGRTRGTLQIQDGCGEHCTYCIIPSVRGDGVSRDPGETVAQARQMVAAGYRELALTGVHSGSYGHDRGETNGLVILLQQLETIDGLQRIRLNSVEPGYVTDELIDYAAGSRRFCRHFHIPLQSGDDRTLRRMGRHYSGAYFAARVEQIASRIPDCCIGTDVMVGFPGESDAEFATTRALLERLPLAYLHVFSYSSRPGTPAARLHEHHPAANRKERSASLIALGDHKRLAFHRRFVGRRLEILAEDRRDKASGLQVGMTDNYIKVLFDDPGVGANETAVVEVTAAREQLVLGEVVATARAEAG